MSQVSRRTLAPDVSYLNRLQQRLQQQPPFDLSRFKFEDSNLGHIEDEIEEEEEEEAEDVVDEEIMEEDEEESVNESIIDQQIIEEEEDISENMETIMEFVEYDIHLLNEGYQQTSGRGTRTARMRVNTNYIHYRIQVPQSILDDTYSDEIEDEEEEVEEDDINELIVDEDMSEYFEKSTCYVPPTMGIDGDDAEQEACAISLLEYKDEDSIATLQCGHEFHAECINKWLHRKKSCPFCRASVLPHN